MRPRPAFRFAAARPGSDRCCLRRVRRDGYARFSSLDACLLYTENQFCLSCDVLGLSGSWEACGDQANLHACSPWDTCPAAAVAEEAVAVAALECNDPVAFNYNASATTDAGCVPVMLGCTGKIFH